MRSTRCSRRAARLARALGPGLALMLAPFVVAYQNPDPEKVSAYECGFNAFDGDTVLVEAVKREAPWAAARCSALGRLAGG